MTRVQAVEVAMLDAQAMQSSLAKQMMYLHMRYLRHQWVIWVGICEQGADGQQHLHRVTRYWIKRVVSLCMLQ